MNRAVAGGVALAFALLSALLGAASSPSAAALRLGAGAGATYVALGDSYSAGEGLDPFEKGTDVDKGAGRNQCHRSVTGAYPVLKPAVVLPQVTSRAFFACSGATSVDMRSVPPQTGAGRQVGQPQQTATVTSTTKYISVSAGGNDVGFGDLGLGCVQALISHSKVVRFSSRSCRDQIETSRSRLTKTKSALVDLYTDLLDRAKNATVVVLGYPRVLPASYEGVPTLNGSQFCVLDHYHLPLPVTVDIGMPVDEAKQLDALTRRLNDTIKDAVRLAGLARPSQQGQLRYADSYSSSVPHNCKGRTSHATVTAAQLSLGHGLSGSRLADKIKKLWIASSTLHPTKDGQKLFASVVQRAFLKTSKPRPPAATWIKLPGTVLSSTDAALLTADDFLTYHPFDGVAWTIGTRSGSPVRIDYTDGMPQATSVELSDTLVTDPTSGHPLGLAILTLRAHFPDNGIDDPVTKGYFSVFDAATGKRLATSAPFDQGIINNSPVAYDGGGLRLAGSDFVTVDLAGNLTHAPLPGNGNSDDATESYVQGRAVQGRVLVAGYDQAPDGCPTLYVVDVATQTTVSQTPCLHDIDLYWGYYFDGAVFAKPDTAMFFSAATGKPVTGAGQLGLDTSETGTSSARFLSPGPRSGLTVVENDGFSYFVSTSSWQTLWRTTEDQPLTPYGVADDDVWVDTYHWEGSDYVGARLVIDGHNGRELARNWRVFPIAGGSGWTVASTNDVCCDREYLLRGAGTLVASLSSVPDS